MITQERLKNLVVYKDGDLYWKTTKSGRDITKSAGCLDRSSNRKRICIDYVYYYAYRLIFLYHYGYIPNFIDHINGNSSDDRIENLRECTKQENNRNSRTPRTNTSGVKNVVWNKKRNKWQVQIMIDYQNKHLGYFEDIELATLVAEEARNKYFKQFAR
jgi:hypothetical protein